MVDESVPSIAALSRFRSLLVLTSVPLIGVLCIIVHACIENTAASTTFIVSLCLLGEVFVVVCLEGRDLFLVSVMLVGLSFKIASACFIFATSRWNTSDALMYSEEGRRLALTSKSVVEIFIGRNVWGTDFIVDMTACIFRAIGPSFLVAMILFTLISFWGQYFYYHAHRDLYPRANPRLVAIGFFLWPSIVFWSSFLGKDALMLFLLGLASLTIAKLSKEATPGMALLLAIAICGCFVVRPHITILLIMSLIVSFGLTKKRSRASNIPRRLFALLLLAIVSAGLVYAMARLLAIDSIEEGQSRSEESMQANRRDGSGFDPGGNMATRVIRAPLLVFRPFPWEARTALAAAASAEGTVLLGLAIYRRKTTMIALRDLDAHGFVVYSLSFISLNLFLMGIGSSNFGLLARGRVMILPLLLFPLLTAFPRGAGGAGAARL